jgi:hypothetical protein
MPALGEASGRKGHREKRRAVAIPWRTRIPTALSKYRDAIDKVNSENARVC